jgi:hypothetical protein
MKRIATILVAVALCFTFVPACTTIKADFAALETKLESVDWNAVAAYWQKFDAGLQKALPIIETLFPQSKDVIDSVVAPVLADSNTAVTAFVGTVQSYKAGTLDAAQVQKAAQDVETSEQSRRSGPQG